MKPEVIEYTLEEFGRQLKTALGTLSGELERMCERKAQLEAELRRCAEAVAAGGDIPVLIEAMKSRQAELQSITDRLLSTGPESVEAHLAEIRQFVTDRLADLRGLLARDVALARTELLKHVRGIRMTPQGAEPKPHYVAEGEWDLLGERSQEDRMLRPSDRSIRMVAGARFELATFGL